MGQNLDFGYGMFSPADNRTVVNEVADDGPVALLVRYIGSEESGLVEVTAGGDLVFTHGVLGSEAADTSVLEEGGTGGTIDVSDTNGNTLGKVVDAINASANWEAVLVDALRGDSSTDTLVDSGPSQAKTPKGLAINVDTSAALVCTLLVAPQVFREDIRVYRAPTPGSNVTVKPSFPFKGTRGEVAYVTAISDFGSGANTVTLVSADGDADNETSVILGGLTDDTLATYDRQNYPFRGALGGRLLVRITGSAAMADLTRIQLQGALKRTFA